MASQPGLTSTFPSVLNECAPTLVAARTALPPEGAVPRLGRPGAADGAGHSFKTEGKVLVKPGWLAIYGKEAQDEAKDGDEKNPAILVAVSPGENVPVQAVEAKGLQTRPPARYSEATLLGAMEGAGKTIEDDELRAAMHEKGLGTPATRSSIIEGLINEKYMLREGRELIPTAKAFQLMTLLRGLGVEELSRAELTGEWEYKLAQMEHGKLSRASFMAEIAAMTERMVKKAKEYDRDTIPGDYATLAAPCPNCGGVVKENYRRYACSGKAGAEEGCGFSFGKTPAGRTFEVAEVEQFLRERRIGPLDGFRSKAGWPFSAEMVIKFDDETKNFKLEFDFGDEKKGEETGELIDFGMQQSLGACPKCGSSVVEHGKNYVCEKSVPTLAQSTPSCDFKTGQVILQQPVSREQISKLLSSGKTSAGQIRLHAHAASVQGDAGLECRDGQGRIRICPLEIPATHDDTTRRQRGRQGCAGGTKERRRFRKGCQGSGQAGREGSGEEAGSKKDGDQAAGCGKGKTRRGQGWHTDAKRRSGCIIGTGLVARTEVVKKIWDYIKANGLQDTTNRRAINADVRLHKVFGKPQVTMFELAGLIGKHLS